MFDIGWTEMLVVAVIAIIFVGPKELPGMIRGVGRTVRKLKSMMGEFQGQLDDALREAELDGLKETVNDVRSLNPTNVVKDKLNPLKDELEKPVTPDMTPQEIEAQIAKDYAAAQKSETAKTKAKSKSAKPAKAKAKSAPAKKSASSRTGSKSKVNQAKTATKKPAARKAKSK